MRAKEGMLAVMTPTWISTRLAVDFVSQYASGKNVGKQRTVRHEFYVQKTPSLTLGMHIYVAEVDADCGSYNGFAYV